jgi:hypothetical protein
MTRHILNPTFPANLTLRRLTLCIYIYIYITHRNANLQTLHFIYLVNKYSTEYFKHAAHSPFFSLQNAVCFIILSFLVHVLFTFYIQVVLKFKNKFGSLRVNNNYLLISHTFRTTSVDISSVKSHQRYNPCCVRYGICINII